MPIFPVFGLITAYFGFLVAFLEVILEPWILRRTLFTQVALFVVVLGACAGFTIWMPKPGVQVGPSNPKVEAIEERPYELNVSREQSFLQLLKRPQTEPKDILRIGCTPTWSEKSCIAAANFLMKFSEAGWVIDTDRVFRMDTQIPNAGVTLCTNFVPPGPKLPPHLGRWEKMNASSVTILCSLAGIGIPFHAGSDPALPNGTLGIYFGPEPSTLTKMGDDLKKVCESPSSAKAGNQ